MSQSPPMIWNRKPQLEGGKSQERKAKLIDSSSTGIHAFPTFREAESSMPAVLSKAIAKFQVG